MNGKYELNKETKASIENLISQLTLSEKIDMVHGYAVYDSKGVDRLRIPPLRMADGPMGVRGELDRITFEYHPKSYERVLNFPCSTAVASTWNRHLAFLHGKALGNEVRGRGKDISLSPGINIHRTPLCGRSFEYESEDPYLISQIAPEIIKGIQENDVAACVKHFAANNQETNRGAVDVDMDERAFHEIYLPGFEAAVKEGAVLSIMGAYNRFRGSFCCESKYLLNDILRKTWGFDGLVISDWGAVHDTNNALLAGCDMDMKVDKNYDEYHYANPLKEKIESGEIEEAALDNMVRRILTLMYRIKMFDPTRKKGAFNSKENRQAILDVARESIVLLKNKKNILPLKETTIKKLAIIGENADTYQASKGGSSEVQALYEITPLAGIAMYLGGNTEIHYAKGYSSQDITEEEREKLAKEALELANNCDACIYVGGLNHDFDMEGCDRKDMKLPFHQDSLIKRLLSVRPDMVIVNMSGSPVEMQEWIEDADTVVQYWYSGSEGGTALAEVIFGAVNPSGKLSSTFPKKLEDTPVYRFGEFPGGDKVYYHEGIFVGYRYYDTYKVEPQFCFGHGLSYTTFHYDALKVINKTSGDTCIEVSLKVTNSGKVAGAETVQLYVSDLLCSVSRPEKELKRFEKIYLKPGESSVINFTLTQEDFSFYSIEDASWKMEKGEFAILVGSSSRDIRLKKTILL